MPRLAHISDIHFGKTFDFDIWRKVKEEIKEFGPGLIIASGDFVDSPDPLLLLAAKCELHDLCSQCGPDTQFFVVPGNHDLLDLGNFWHPAGNWWFERVMFNDISQVRDNLEAGLNFKLGLNEQTLRWSRFPKISRLKPGNWVWKQKSDGRVQSCDYHRGGKRWPSQSIHDQTLIACFNSNAAGLKSFVFATGEVDRGQVNRLGNSPVSEDCSCGKHKKDDPAIDPESAVLLRVAVLHHHPLPIAVRNKSLQNQGAEAKLEPFLVLKNGGDLIHELQRQRFDLILHGHKHRPQFARVELRADDPEDYPLLVLAGGSTAKQDEDAPDNTLRDIGTEPNGRLKIRTFEQGVLQEQKLYQEPIAVLKRRAFVRAIERAKISAKELYSEIVIDGVGHLRSFDRTTGLRVRSKKFTLEGMAINVALAAHDERLDIDLDDSCRGQMDLCWRDSNDTRHSLTKLNLPSDGYCWLSFRAPFKSDTTPVSFGVREAAANSIAMTRWKLSERSRHGTEPVDPDYEHVGFYIGYPVEKLILSLQLPAELDRITPEVICRRHPEFPKFPLTFLPGQRLLGQSRDFRPDIDLMKEEAKRLRYDAGRRCWILEIDRPLPGNTYFLQWRVPDPMAEPEVVDRTSAYQDLLRTLPAAEPASRVAVACKERFAELAKRLMKRFHSKINPLEKQTAFLMVYDAKNLCLRPVLAHSSGGALFEGSYDVPLGGGVAGAAFLQRRILAWKNDPTSKSLIKPRASDNLNSRWVLALPIFYQQRDASGDLKLDLLPGAIIGVVTLGSDLLASNISECAKEDETAEQLGQEAQKFAQECVYDILEILREDT